MEAMIDSGTIVRAAPPEATYPLTALQRGMLFQTLLDEHHAANLNQLVCTLREEIDVHAFRTAWEQVSAAHDILRTAFRWDDEPLQYARADVAISLRVEDWRGEDAEHVTARLRTFLRDDRARGIALDRAPLFRLALLRVADAEYRFVWTMHHAIMDGATLGVVLPAVLASYRAAVLQRPPEVSAQPQFREHVAWLEEQHFERHERLWRDRLEGFTAPTPLPAAFLPPAGDASGGDVTFPSRRLSLEASAAVHRFVRERGVTVTTLAQGAWALLLALHGGEDDVVFGVTRACRRHGTPNAEHIAGPFVNTLPLRVRVDRDLSIAAYLDAIRAQWNALRDCEHTPLALIQQWSSLETPSPLFESILVTHAGRLEDQLAHACGERFWSAPDWSEHTTYALAVHVTDAPQIGVAMSFDAQRYDAATVARLLDQFVRLVDVMAAGSAATIGDIDVLTPEARAEIRAFGEPAPRSPRTIPVHELFAEQALRRPHAVAAAFGDRSLTYAQLDARANEIALRLRGSGVRRGDRVGVCVERSFVMPAAMLGILKTGAAYVPLDPGYPEERLRLTIGDARLAAVVTQPRLMARLEDVFAGGPHILTVDDGDEPERDRTEELPGAGVVSDDAACVMYTSGSTGTPKGVVVPHRAIARLVCDADYVRLGPDERVLAFAPLAFDASTFEIFAPLLNGGCVVLSPPAPSLEGLAQTVERHRVTTLFLTTALFERLEHGELARFGSVRQLLFGGEVCSPAQVRRIAALLPHCALANVYGPTENTTFTTCYPLPAAPSASAVPIGKPIAGTTVYVLDENRRLVPIGVPGELCTGGDGVALGYLDRAEATNERFVDDPFSSRPGARMYRTGDLARWRPDGTLEFLGRRDDQVKVRGFRIEPGEIEAALRAIEGVGDAVVAARPDALGGKRLVGYVVPDENAHVDRGAIVQRLAAQLPAHLVPAAIVTLASLPLTPNGKIDRRALPDPDASTTAARPPRVAPRTLTEQILARIWSRTLGVAEIGVDDEFFALGGDSLQAMRLMATIRDTFAIDVPIRVLYEQPTIATLAAVLAAQEPGAERKASARTRLGAVREAGSRPPFVFMHGDLKSGGYYAYAMARHLDADQPFYVLDPHGVDGQPLPASIEAMAAECVRELRALQPHGPYRLGGYCAGGLVALETARLLERGGEHVDRLVLIESDGGNCRFIGLAAFVSRIAAALRLPAHVAARVTGAVARRLRLGVEMARFDRTQWRAFFTRKRTELFGPRGAGESPRTAAEASDEIVYRWQGVIWRYVPRVYAQPVLMLFASEGGVEARPHQTRWRAALPRLDVHPLPGDHFTCITRHIADTAAVLQRYLDGAVRE